MCIVGDGARRRALEELAVERGVTELVRFSGRLPKSEMPVALASSDCLLIHLKESELFETVIPSKIFEAMAMERPIVMGVRGESAAIVREARAGIEMRPGDAASLVDALTKLADDTTLCESLSRHGREFVLNRYSRDVFAQDYLRLLNRVIGRPIDRTGQHGPAHEMPAESHSGSKA